MSRIVMNMLGDHTAEEGSWRMSAMSEGLPQPIDTATWENLKLQAGDELRSEIAVKESCKVAKEAMKDTIIGNSIEEKQLAKAIATSSNFNEASQYAAMTAYQGEHTTPDGASVIWINEHVQRAAHVTGTEYFLPILIPAEDITQGWYKAVRAVKEASAEETKQITFYEDAIPKESIPRSKPIAKIISCASDGLCDSDAQFLRYPALEEIYSSLQSKTFDGKRYKLVAPNL